MLSKIKEILETAVYAPSGDNSQPWSFELQDNVLKVLNLPDRDNPIFNFEQRGSLIAHGALLENISLLSSAYGLKASITIIESKERADMVATVEFTEVPITPNPLAEYIRQRQTNRKAFSCSAISPEIWHEIDENVESYSDFSLVKIEDRNEIVRLSTLVSWAERTMLQFKPLHQYFFSAIQWSAKQVAREKMGLFIKTLELEGPKKLIFKLYSHWKIARFFNLLKLPRLIAQENAAIYSQAGAFVAITCSSGLTSRATYITCGRIMQRLWLILTKHHISVQPTGGVLYLAQRIATANDLDLKESIRNEVLHSSEEIHRIIKQKNGTILMLMRIGETLERPSASSPRLEPKIDIT